MKEKLKKIYFKITGPIKRKRLNHTDFTIISNNCFGSVFFRDNALKYNSPTCGMAFMAEDYIKFIYNMKYYLEQDMVEITVDESKYSSFLKKTKYSSVLVKIEDIEIMMVHFDTFDEALTKWNRRKERINWKKIIYKFNDQNLCTYEQLKKFDEFNAKNKICFTAKHYNELDTIQLDQFEGYEYALSDVRYKDYKKQFNMYEFVNNGFGKENE